MSRLVAVTAVLLAAAGIGAECLGPVGEVTNVSPGRVAAIGTLAFVAGTDLQVVALAAPGPEGVVSRVSPWFM